MQLIVFVKLEMNKITPRDRITNLYSKFYCHLGAGPGSQNKYYWMFINQRYNSRLTLG